MALKLLQNNTDINILLILDNIQNTFKIEEIAAGLLGRFKKITTSRMSCLYISNQNSVLRKMSNFIFLLILG